MVGGPGGAWLLFGLQCLSVSVLIYLKRLAQPGGRPRRATPSSDTPKSILAPVPGSDRNHAAQMWVTSGITADKTG